MAQHLGLGRPIELMGYIYLCPICKQKLWTLRSPDTNWQEWCFTENEERHFKNRCNFPRHLSKQKERPMVRVICDECGHIWMAPTVTGATCPECGSNDNYVAETEKEE